MADEVIVIYSDEEVVQTLVSPESEVTVVAEGIPGPGGAVGPQGPQGIQGPQGPIGLTGPQGIQGVAGPQGPQGDPGVDGADGADGATGPQGPIGLTGPQGPQGIQGPVGPQGPAGADGADGAVGPQGPPGADGADGDPGPAGPPGADGATGPAGPAGADGADGVDATIITYASMAELDAITQAERGILIMSGSAASLASALGTPINDYVSANAGASSIEFLVDTVVMNFEPAAFYEREVRQEMRAVGALATFTRWGYDTGTGLEWNDWYAAEYLPLLPGASAAGSVVYTPDGFYWNRTVPLSDPLPNTIMSRDADGRAQVTDPSAGADIANKQWVESVALPINDTHDGRMALAKDGALQWLDVAGTYGANVITWSSGLASIDQFALYERNGALWKPTNGSVPVSPAPSATNPNWRLIGLNQNADYLHYIAGTALFANWQSSRTYAAGDLVYNGGAMYRAKVAITTGQAAPPSNANWHNVSLSALGALLAGQTTVVVTTASLATNASEQGTLTLPAGFVLTAIATTRSARVRLYVDAASATADAARAEGTAPTGWHGLILEAFPTGSGTQKLPNDVPGSPASGTTVGYIITNKGAAGTVQLTLTYRRTE